MPADSLRSAAPRPMPTQPHWLRATFEGAAVGVDRAARVIRGYVVAQEGAFKTAGRGEFDRAALAKIVELMRARPAGLKSRFAHPGLSDDGIGSYLGRAKNARLDMTTIERDGARRMVAAVRADLHLDPTSFTTPRGNLGGYVLDLAESDPDAISSSLVLSVEKEQRLDADGRPLVDEQGEELPPLWRPTRLHASDIVDEGEAVDGLLSAHDLAALAGLDIDRLPDALQRRAWQIMHALFAGQPREACRARALAFVERYLADAYGPEPTPPGASIAERRRRLELRLRG